MLRKVALAFASALAALGMAEVFVRAGGLRVSARRATPGQTS